MKFSELDLAEKNLFILTHARTGSTWFTRSFKHHYKIGEIFNFNMDIINSDARGLRYVSCQSYHRDIDVILNDRIALLNNKMKECKIVVKYLWANNTITDKNVLNFLVDQNKSDSKFILLQRKNKFNVFISHIIAKSIDKWISTSTNPINFNTQISVDESTLRHVINKLNEFQRDITYIRSEFSPYEIYYEDLLNESENFFWKSNPYFLIQDGKLNCNITNKYQIINFLHKQKFVFKEEIIAGLLKII